MATAAMRNASQCCICFETFKTPKILPCGHTFCLICIEGYTKSLIGETGTFPCPTCKRDVKIPEGGAKEFTTNYIAIDNQPPSTTQPKCPNHKRKEVDYYCNNCNVGMCLKCVLGQHKEHETLDIECDETRNKAIEKLQHSQKIIQNRIKNLEKTRSTLLESFEQLKFWCEDACGKVTEQTEQIVSNIRNSCKQIIKDIRNNLEENRSTVEDREKEITSDINVLESNTDSNISPSTETTLNILLTLPRLKEIQKLGESNKDYNLCMPYLQWVGKDFSLDIEQLGSVISKTFYIPSYIPGSYQFIFNVSDIEEDDTDYYSKNKFRNNNLVWSCRVKRSGDDLGIYIELSQDDNPKLDYCIIDCQISLLNFDDNSKSVTKTFSEERLESGDWLIIWKSFLSRLRRRSITWSELTGKNNGYLDSKGQFVVQFDIKEVKEIEFNQ